MARIGLSFSVVILFFLIFLIASTVENGKKRQREPAAGSREPSTALSRGLGARRTQGTPPSRYEPDEELRSRPQKRLRTWLPWGKSEPEDGDLEPIPEKLIPPETLIDLERKWQAVLAFRELQCSGKSTNKAVDEIGAFWDVGTGRNVRYLSEMATTRGSLMRKEGSGAPKSVTGRKDIQEFFREQAEEWEYSFTYEAMALALQGKFEVGSTYVVKSLMDLLEWRKSRRSVKPFLTEEHMLARKEWAKEWEDFDFFDSDTVVVHIDEKCFYAFDRRGKVVYLPPDVEAKPFHALSKVQIPYVMFLGAVAAPRPDKGFDGKIGLYHVGEIKTAERRSKYHERGDEYMVNIIMDGDVFMEMMENQVIPAILKKCKWAKRVIVQFDSAGGHRVGESVDYLNHIGSRKKPQIEFITQPSRSPDTNVLDLGIWRSMASRVTTVRYQRYSSLTTTQRIINAVEDMWREYDENVLHNIFVTLKLVLYEIESHNGGNDFKLPHSVKNE